MNRGMFMRKKAFSLFLAGSLCLFFAACGPSDDKVEEARQKYTQLAETHNQVVEAHKNVDDDSLDKALSELRGRISEIESYNLSEMADEEIDELIQSMDSLIESYEGYFEELVEIKGQEEAATLIPITIAVTNQTEFSFSKLKLYEKENYDTHADVLENMEMLDPGETLTGLVVRRDVDNTPWILALEDTNGMEYQLELPVEEYGEEGQTLTLTYDTEAEKLLAQ